MANPYTSGLDLSKSRTIGNPYMFMDGISEEELVRVRRELAFWKFYKGDQWDIKRPDGEPQNTINYSARFVDKGVAFLMGKGFTINVAEEAEEVTKPFLDFVWEDNDKELLSFEMAQSGGVSGNAWVKVVLEEYDKKEDPLLYEMYPKGRIRLLLLPGYFCFPIYDNHDRTRLESIRIIYPIRVPVPGKKNEYQEIFYKEEITKKEIREYLDDELIESRPNDIGIIPVVQIRNLPIANESFGISDLADVVPLNKEFNEKTTDVSDIINYHASPITLIFGAKANNLEKGARKIWSGLSKDAKVENLELKSDLTASMKYIELIKKAMFEVANMPEDALGSQTNVSNTSGVALHIKNQPLIDRNNAKKITYGKGIEMINRIILRYADIYELDGFNYSEFRNLDPKVKWTSEVEFPNPLPKDELLQMQLIAQKLTHQLITRLDALKELGEHNAQAKLEQIKEEIVEWQNLMFEADPTNDPMNDPDYPNIQGVNRNGLKKNNGYNNDGGEYGDE